MQVDAQEAAVAKLRAGLAEAEGRLQAALAVGRNTQEAATLETARRATALSEARAPVSLRPPPPTPSPADPRGAVYDAVAVGRRR